MLRATVARCSRSCFQLLLLALLVSQIAGPVAGLAQQARTEGKRKFIVEIRPVYPLLARKINLSGVVRLRVTVSPAGNPGDIEQLGGSPVLLKAAMEAVSKAQWEPAPGETKEIVQIRFEAKN